MRHSIITILFISMVLVVVGCSGDDDPASPPAANNIGAEGGTVTGDEGMVELVFPAGAVDETIEVSISPVASAPDDPGMILGRAYDFEPDGVQFLVPVTMTIHYQDAEVPAGVDENDLLLCKAEGGSWQAIAGSAVSGGDNTVSAAVMSFSSYAPGLPSAATVGQISITPEEITMPSFGTVTFEALVTDLENTAATWSITEGEIGGRVRGNGIYNAPGGGGEFHLRVTSVENPALFAEAEITVATDWECPEVPPEPAYELVWAHHVPDIFTRHIYGITWHQGNLWVGGQAHLEHWTDGGVHLGWTGRGVDGPWPFDETYTGYHAGASETDVPAPADDDGQFTDVLGMACDANGNVYACDFGNSRVTKMSSGGAYMTQWDFDRPMTIGVSPDHNVYVVGHIPSHANELGRYTTQGEWVESITTLEEGVDLERFKLLGFDQVGEIFLFFEYEERIVARMDKEHQYLGSSLREGEGVCESEGAFTVDADGNIYTADPLSGLFKKFNPDGWLMATWPQTGPGYEESPGIGGMTVDDYGNVYATDWVNGRILKFRPVSP